MKKGLFAGPFLFRIFSTTAVQDRWVCRCTWR
jgi:hypothetical protein